MGTSAEVVMTDKAGSAQQSTAQRSRRWSTYSLFLRSPFEFA
jgi:hypothetical protein